MSTFDQILWDEGLFDQEPTPSTGPPIFLGLIDGEPLFLGKEDAALSLGVMVPVAVKPPAFLGKIDGELPLGTVNAGAQKLGAMQGAGIRLGRVPIRTGS